MTARKTPPAMPAAPADSGGIISESAHGAAAVLKLAALAGHPANPRGEDLGDLGELQASVAEIGVLEPLVVATVAAHLAGGWPAVAETATHVILAGHRRHAAAAAAGVDEVSCIVRDDLAGDDALTVMLSENDPGKRHGLTPLAEAAAFAQLAERGWSQRKIAARVGCGQAHVSKRLTLLRLPEPAIEALAGGKITAADGAELARLCSAGHPGLAMQALEEIDGTGWASAENVVSRRLAQLERDEQAAAVRAAMEAEGIKVVDPDKLGPRAWARRLDDDADLAPHREAGCLTGVARAGGRELYCTDPAAHEGTAAALPGAADAGVSAAAEAARAGRDRQNAAAARSRKAAAGQLAVRPVTAARAAELVSLALIARHADAQCLETAVKWLRAAGIGPASGDYYEYAETVAAAGDLAAIRRLAVAMGLASDERAAAGQPGYGDGRWEARQVAYLDRLVSEAGYEPGEWEQRRLDEARGRIAARAGMSCAACGCRPGKTCGQFIRLAGGSWVKCDAEPAADGSWEYRCACGGRKADPEGVDEADARDDLFDAVEALAFVLDRAGTVAEQMSEALAGAVEEPADVLAEAFAEQDGDGDTSELLQAVRTVHAAALPYEAGWPRRLRAAFAELEACGVLSGEPQGKDAAA
jgi:ParB/RepB/Spo0J family partition protein